GEHHSPTSPLRGPLQPCCPLCAVACVAATSGAPRIAVALAGAVVHSVRGLPPASVPSGKVPARLLPPSLGPPARS
ncbi:MAG: hypothetical protein ACREL2_02525, partial [Gemmatimonadales bacterium]